MSMLSLHHGDHHIRHEASPTHGVGTFVADWFEATPAALLVRPVGSLLADWMRATPIAILARALRH
ncbi:hypothetical protein [Azospirillum picis]|uniref:Uncharacterized protein n=1 Tax=Azospirillum picis TaxID=488438 RepID=A0ABU0MFY3_9PROT|nr:hypothetical protein [Azospirillum picis]MBP2298609.1 hypothetical protein [Azospirillum picis]MDQ0532342.1 hypothetical protein [Azospirillum picis]